MSPPHVHDEPGPLGDEAARLLAAAQGWLQRSVGDAAAGRIATGSQECAWCPLCQLIALLRGDRVDVTRSVVAERFGEAQTALAALLHALADAASTMTAAGSAGTRGHPDPAAAGPERPADRPPERVQRIDLTGPGAG